MPASKKALYFLTGLAIFFGVFIIIVFHEVETSHIENSAIETLSCVVDEDYCLSNESLPEYFLVHTGDDWENQLPEEERNMLKYYMSKKEKLPYNKVCVFEGDGSLFYFMAVDEKSNEALSYLRGEGTPILYVNASFETALVKRTTFILTVMMIVIAAALYFAGNVTARILAKKEKATQSFFENASHELKTPLMAIEGYNDGVRKGLVSREEGCQIISRETERMTCLVGNILKLSRLDGGITEIDKKENDVREIIYDVLITIEAAAEQKGLRIEIELPQPLMAYCDEEMIFSAISNIMTNSIRFADSSIGISAFRDGSWTVIRIRDDGKGVSPEDAKHIFERFYKGEKGQNGIGMALAYEYIRLHKGEITVKSGKNPQFEIRLP